ncbi:MAG: hypothetical protein H6739_39845 [Alphaproteobacteria bacterium]|nr:hypothetical protein [Alphaproteobacteria bacterium]
MNAQQAPIHEPSDEVLMARVRQDDRVAYEQLFARWRQPLYRYLHRRTGSASLADDAFQETWLKVYKHRARFDPARRFKPWLYRIATNGGL